MFLVHPKNTVQRFILLAGTVFFLSLSIIAYHRSVHRKSILSDLDEDGEGKAVFDKIEAQAAAGSKLSLQDFERVEIRDGRPVWEVRAKDASYFAVEQVSHVNDALVKVYRVNRGPLQIRADAAKLQLSNQSIGQAELEGRVVFTLDDATTVTTDLAVYNVKERIVSAPGEVKVSGSGFELSGVGLTMDIDEQKIRLSEQVGSRFEPSAKPPRLDFPMKKF